MLPANGLYGHIQKNTMKSALLLASFVVLIMLFWYAWCVIYTVVADHLIGGYVKRINGDYDRHAIETWQLLSIGLDRALDRWMVPLIVAGGWFIVAYLVHADFIRMATRARPVSRADQPRLYKIVERVAINAGVPMPRIEIINTSALNAYAAGLSPNDAVIAVTWGLLQTLSDDELEAVVAHEISHIKNYDVRLMVVATVFTGGLTLLGEAVAGWVSSGAPGAEQGAVAVLKTGTSTAADEELHAARITAILVSLALAILFLALTHLFAILIKLAISRSREYIADAGAIELTKNPDAMISALQRIAENDEVPGIAPSTQAMMISCSVGGLFSTHPEVADRIAALQKFAGGRVAAPRTRRASNTAAAAPMSTDGAITAPAGAIGFGRRRAAPLPRR